MVVRNRWGDRGAAAVEFALVLPPLLLLIFGIIDFGRMLNAQLTATEAAREGARARALGESASARVDTVFGGPGVATTTVNSSCPTNPTAGQDAKVTVTYTFSFVTPIGFMAGILPNGTSGGTLSLTGVGVMPCRA